MKKEYYIICSNEKIEHYNLSFKKKFRVRQDGGEVGSIFHSPTSLKQGRPEATGH